MAIHIDISICLLISLLTLAFIPLAHLVLIFLVMDAGEWFYKLFEKCGNLLLIIYEIITHILENPIILTIILIGLIVYLSRVIIE